MKDDQPVTVEITGGIVPPTTYVLLPKALTALWSALRFRPMSRSGSGSSAV
ncbi:hypothetical protein ABT093_11770 [Kitasatospora sp. NPDC002551]|uniref:hypothetical protein n=1 Tax=unclassified Kitasatospora TaxID=2633591 RepID=UPI003330C56B